MDYLFPYSKTALSHLRLHLQACYRLAEKVSAVIPLICPRSVASSLPVPVSHNCTLLSVPPLANIFPFGENAKIRTETETNGSALFVGFLRIIGSLFPVVPHNRTVAFSLPIASCDPSGENANPKIWSFFSHFK